MFFLLIGFFILLLCFVSPFKFSLLFIIYYLLFLSPIDSYAIFEFIKRGNDAIYVGSAALLVFSYGVFGFHFIKNRKIFSANIRNFIFFINLLIFIIFFNTFLKNFDLLYSISVTMSTGLPFCLIIPFVYFSNKALNSFIALIAIKIFLSISVIYNPDLLFFINGAFYQKELGLFVLDAQSNSLSGSLTLDKALVGSYGIFHNPNSLGFHSVLLVSCSLFLIFIKNNLAKILGFLFLFLSILGWLNSLTRGPLVLLLISIVFLYIIKNKKSYMKINFALISLIFITMCFWLAFSDSLISYLIPSSDNISVTGRLAGYKDGLEAFLDNPILGIDNTNPKWENLHVPHLFFLFYAYQFGFLPALIVFFLIFGLFFKILIKVISLKYLDNIKFLSIMWLFVLLGIALTNNFTSPFIFWSLFTLILLMVYQDKDKLNV